MSHWSLVYDEFDPEQQGLREALCTLGNGYLATRGAGTETLVEASNIQDIPCGWIPPARYRNRRARYGKRGSV